MKQHWQASAISLPQLRCPRIYPVQQVVEEKAGNRLFIGGFLLSDSSLNF
jgi:hypothetical protein